jgi:hypothetical protein
MKHLWMAALLSLSLNSPSVAQQQLSSQTEWHISDVSLRVQSAFEQVEFPQIVLNTPFKQTDSTRIFLMELSLTLKEFTKGNKTTEAIFVGMTNRSIQNIVATIEEQPASKFQKALMLEGSIDAMIVSYKKWEKFDDKDFVSNRFSEIVDDVMETTTVEWLWDQDIHETVLWELRGTFQ